MRVYEAAPPSMRFVWELATGYGDRDYVVFEDERYTYAESDSIIRALAHHLRDVHGVGRGDRVALAMRNYPEWVFGYWAIVSIGAACVGMNAWWTTDEMEYGLADSAPKVLIADSERVERVVPILSKLRERHAMHLIAVRTEGASRRAPTTGTMSSTLQRRQRDSPLLTSTLMTMRASSTPPARPGSPREHSSHTAVRCITCSISRS